jgi:arylsulfatase A
MRPLQITLTLCTSLMVFSCSARVEADKPNFVVIFIDDMGYGDIQPFGSTINATPNLNRMAAEETRLTAPQQ